MWGYKSFELTEKSFDSKSRVGGSKTHSVCWSLPCVSVEKKQKDKESVVHKWLTEPVTTEKLCPITPVKGRQITQNPSLATSFTIDCGKEKHPGPPGLAKKVQRRSGLLGVKNKGGGRRKKGKKWDNSRKK